VVGPPCYFGCRSLSAVFSGPHGVIDSAPLAGCYIEIRLRTHQKPTILTPKYFLKIPGRGHGPPPRATSLVNSSTPYSFLTTRTLTSRLPGTANPLNFIQTTWGIGSVGVKEARNCRPPRFWTWQGTAPSFTMISRLPVPACDASTAQPRHQFVYLRTAKTSN